MIHRHWHGSQPHTQSPNLVYGTTNYASAQLRKTLHTLKNVETPPYTETHTIFQKLLKSQHNVKGVVVADSGLYLRNNQLSLRHDEVSERVAICQKLNSLRLPGQAPRHLLTSLAPFVALSPTLLDADTAKKLPTASHEHCISRRPLVSCDLQTTYAVLPKYHSKRADVSQLQFLPRTRMDLC